MEHHEHAASGLDIEPGSTAWSEWVKDYYRDVETYDWVDVADNLRGLEAFFHRNRARVVRRLVARYAVPGEPILDAGCGTGLNLRHLPVGSTGIDINPRNVALLKQRLPNHQVIEGDVEALPFADASFGTVLCTEVLEHVPDPAAALRGVSSSRPTRRGPDRLRAGTLGHLAPALPVQHVPAQRAIPQ